MKKSLFLGLTIALMSVVLSVHAAGDPDAGKTKSVTCAACHGANGEALVPDYPNLGGQGEGFLIKQLQDFKAGSRENALMSPMALPLSDQDIEDLSAYYASLPAKAGVANEENLELGQSIYRGGITSVKIPACIGCHGPSGSGNPAAKYPALSGQNASYIAKTLGEFRAGTRTNDPNKMMRSLALRLTDTEILAVSNYVQGLN